MEQSNRDALARALAHPRFELIPIKGVEEQATSLPPGATVAITSSPSRGVENTLAYAERLAAQGFQVVPHIAARSVRDLAHLHSILYRVDTLRLRDVFVVGGDARPPAGTFANGIELLRAMAKLGHGLEAIGVPSYPEAHPFIDEAALRRDLLEKQRFATYTVTQICFDPARIMRWLLGLRREGLRLPVFVGLPGMVDRKKLLGITMRIGVGESMRFLSKNTRLATNLLSPDVFRPDELAIQLAPAIADPGYGLAGLHINTFNQVASSQRWVDEMVQRLGVDASKSAQSIAGQAV